MFLREKICQYLNFGKIFYLGTFCAHTCLQEAFKKGIRVGLEIRTKSWPKSQKTQIFTVLTPPTLAKSATKLDSIKKLTKGLFLISPIPGRMQKFREIVCADREKGIRIFSGFIYVTTTRTGQGPYPALNDNECTNSDHLGGRRGQEQVFALNQEFSTWYVPLECFESLLLFFIVIWQCPSGTLFVHDIYNFTHFLFFSICPVELSEWAQYINLTLVSQCEHFLGPGPTKSAHKIFQILGKNSMSKKSKIFSFDFGSKNYADRCNLTSELRGNSFFDQKKILKIFDFRT